MRYIKQLSLLLFLAAALLFSITVVNDQRSIAANAPQTEAKTDLLEQTEPPRESAESTAKAETTVKTEMTTAAQTQPPQPAGPAPENALQLLEGLSVNGRPLPGTAEGVYYLTVEENTHQFPADSAWSTAFHGEITLPKELLKADPAEAAAKGESFTFTVSGHGFEQSATLIFTTFPVMEISFADGLSASDIVHGDDGEDVPCAITLNESGMSQSLTGHSAGIHIRGGTARHYPKKSYKFSLQNQWGDSYKTSLLGMRSDDDWILLAGYTDASKIREQLGMAIWSEMVADRAWSNYAYELKPIELIMDGEYAGIYLLQEPVDAKLLDLNDDQFLYKCSTWTFPDRAKNSWGGFEMKAPKIPGMEEQAFGYLCDYTELLTAGKDDFLAVYEQAIDWEEVIDHCLFTSYIYAYDNKMNNIYYVASPDSEGLHVRFVPWDLDCAFGYSNWLFVFEDGTTEQHYLNRMPFKGLEETHAIIALQTHAPEQAAAMLLERWTTLRQTVITEENITAKVAALFDRMETSGAYARDSALWDEYFPLEADEEEYLTTFLTAQIGRMDDIVGYAG